MKNTFEIIGRSRYGVVRFRKLEEIGWDNPIYSIVIEAEGIKGLKPILGLKTKDHFRSKSIELFEQYQKEFEAEKEMMKKLGFFCYGYGDYYLDGLSISTKAIYLKQADFLKDCFFKGIINWNYLSGKSRNKYSDHSLEDFIFEFLNESKQNFYLLPSKMRDGLLMMNYG